MSRILVVSTLALLVAAVRPEAQSPPKLVVILVVDQMRADYLQRFAHHWRGGFRTLLNEGAVFDRAAYPFMNTVTCAGHATISTGTQPRTHGMVLNAWWHRDVRALQACMDDTESPHISYGRPAKSGSSPKRLLVPTLADELRSQKSGARVASISLKPRSAIGLAGHGGDVVTWFDETDRTFVTSRAFAASPVPAVQAFITSDPFEKEAGRTWSLRENADTYRFPDANLGARPPAGWNGLFPHQVAGREGADAQFTTLWQSSPLSDAYLTRMATALIKSLALGQRDTTDFLGVSFSALDLVGHRFGPESREVEDLLAHLDMTLGTLITQLDAQVGRSNYVLALTSDHGVASIPIPGVNGRIPTADVRERIEEALTKQFGPKPAGTYVEAMVFNYVYFAEETFTRLLATPAAYRAVEDTVLGIPGVARLLRGDQLSDTSRSETVRAAALSYMPGRSGDLVIIPKQDWFLAGRTDTTATTHGSGQAYDREIPLILFGARIKPGRIAASATPADIAPTLAHLAAVRMPKAEGRVLREALR
jgi:predicted AlkP superfamily pyrophosphatase or phosphodiesterase